jgi:hypothetical protein
MSREEDKARGNRIGYYLSRSQETWNAAATMVPVKGILIRRPDGIKLGHSARLMD